MKRPLLIPALVAVSLLPAAAVLATGNDGKVICHNGQTITIDYSAWPAHRAHGDTKGACTPVDTTPTTDPVDTTPVTDPPDTTVPDTAEPPVDTTPVTDPPVPTTDPPVTEVPVDTTVPDPPVDTTVPEPPTPPEPPIVMLPVTECPPSAPYLDYTVDADRVCYEIDPCLIDGVTYLEYVYDPLSPEGKGLWHPSFPCSLPTEPIDPPTPAPTAPRVEHPSGR